MCNASGIKVSLFGNFYDKQPMERPLLEVEELMKSEELKALTTQIRILKAKAEDPATPIAEVLKAKDQADKLKKKLPSFLTNVLCRDGKARKHIQQFLPMVGFDVDHLSEDDVNAMMAKLKHDPFVVIAEPSCSGKGVHFALFHNAADWLNSKWDGRDTAPFDYVYQNVMEYAELLIEAKVDDKCKNPERIFGICGDDRLYLNANPMALEIDISGYVEATCKNVRTNAESNHLPGTYHASIQEVTERIIRHLEEKGIRFASGSRNDFVLRFAYGCNLYGVSQNEVESYCTSQLAESDFTEKEILATIRSAYSKVGEHGTLCATCASAQQYANIPQKEDTSFKNRDYPFEQVCADAQTAQNVEEENNDEISFHQTFSDKIDEKDWPPYFTPVLGSMDDAESKDKMLLGTLVMNSGILPNYYGIYGGHTVFPSLYLLFYGPSASRKGEIGSCQHIVKPLKDEIVGEYQQKMEEYKLAHSVWESKGSKAADRADRGDEPKEPEYRSPIIPANSSASAAYLALKANDGWGIMFETEAAALTQSLLSDYGDFSTGLLAAYHHEPIKMNRVKDKVRFDIDKPRLAIGLTCTAGQLPKLFPTFEDGLGNRFLYYGLNRKLAWINPFKKVEKPLEVVYEELGEVSLELYHQMRALGDKRIQFVLTEEQIDQFNSFFSDLLMEQFKMLGDGISSFIFRLGLSTFRIAMVLTLLRRYSEWDKAQPFFADNEQAVTCNEKDFNIALTIMNTLVNHTATIYAALAKDDEGLVKKELAEMSQPERVLYDALSDEFSSDDVKETASCNHINPDTARRYLGKYVNAYHVAERVKNGLYRKIKK